LTNCFLFFFAKGGINWLVLNHYSETPFVDRYGSIIFVALINRLMPYGIVILTQIESYKYLSYRLDAVGFRSVEISFLIKKQQQQENLLSDVF